MNKRDTNSMLGKKEIATWEANVKAANVPIKTTLATGFILITTF